VVIAELIGWPLVQTWIRKATVERIRIICSGGGGVFLGYKKGFLELVQGGSRVEVRRAAFVVGGKSSLAATGIEKINIHGFFVSSVLD
jgi:hypothetical protein